MQASLGRRPQLAAAVTSQAERPQIVRIGPFDGPQDIRAVAGAADGNQQVAGRGEVFQLLDEDALKPFVVGPSENVGRVVGQAEDAQPRLGVVVVIFAADGAFAGIFAKVRGVRPTAAVADDEHHRPATVGVVHGVAQRLDLGRIDRVISRAARSRNAAAVRVLPSIEQFSASAISK